MSPKRKKKRKPKVNLRIKQRRERDLTKAIDLRPVDIFELYGISASTLHSFCTAEDDERRLPSVLIPGRSGRRGVRLINHDDFRAWRAKWRTGKKAA